MIEAKDRYDLKNTLEEYNKQLSKALEDFEKKNDDESLQKIVVQMNGIYTILNEMREDILKNVNKSKEVA